MDTDHFDYTYLLLIFGSPREPRVPKHPALQTSQDNTATYLPSSFGRSRRCSAPLRFAPPTAPLNNTIMCHEGRRSDARNGTRSRDTLRYVHSILFGLLALDKSAGHFIFSVKGMHRLEHLQQRCLSAKGEPIELTRLQ